VPPDTAGEEFDHGITLRIHPRARDIGKTYSGCQAILTPDKGHWGLVEMVVIESGDPVRIWSPTSSASNDCLYGGGSLKHGDPGKCPDPRFLLFRSLAPGCVAKIQKAVAEGGLGAPRPSDCQRYE